VLPAEIESRRAVFQRAFKSLSKPFQMAIIIKIAFVVTVLAFVVGSCIASVSSGKEGSGEL
jgi:hypothetical protein